MIKVKLTIQRQGLCGVIQRVLDVEKQATAAKTKEFAELQYCNLYVGRDLPKVKFRDAVSAKKFAKLKITSEIIN